MYPQTHCLLQSEKIERNRNRQVREKEIDNNTLSERKTVDSKFIPSSYNSIVLISHRCSVHQTLNLDDESMWLIPFINCVEMLDKIHTL